MHMTKLAALLFSGMLSSAAFAAGGETMEREKDTTFGTEVGAELRKPTPVEDPGHMRERGDAQMERQRPGTMMHDEDMEMDTEQDADFPGSVRPDSGSGAPDR